MKIHCESLNHYLAWLRDGWHFAFAGYSDAEWYCMMGLRAGKRTALGQKLDPAHGQKLLDVMRRRQSDPRFLFAIPKCLYSLPEFSDGQIDWFLGREDIRVEGYERDMVTDDLARQGDLYPLIRQLQDMEVCVIGPRDLRGTKPFLRYKHFVEISTPNLHMEEGGIHRAKCQTMDWLRGAQPGKVVLVSAGVSAAVIIHILYESCPSHFYLDCGSIWDGFVRIGGQRQWRADLYGDQRRYERWLKDNLEGKHTP